MNPNLPTAMAMRYNPDGPLPNNYDGINMPEGISRLCYNVEHTIYDIDYIDENKLKHTQKDIEDDILNIEDHILGIEEYIHDLPSNTEITESIKRTCIRRLTRMLERASNTIIKLKEKQQAKKSLSKKSLSKKSLSKKSLSKSSRQLGGKRSRRVYI